MKTRNHTKHIHAGKYVAEVDVQLIAGEDDWAPIYTMQPVAL